jgi:hypothetical protein
MLVGAVHLSLTHTVMLERNHQPAHRTHTLYGR